jgi:hypothetical protein
MFKHGLYTKEVLKERHLLRKLLRQARDARSSIPEGLGLRHAGVKRENLAGNGAPPAELKSLSAHGRSGYSGRE